MEKHFTLTDTEFEDQFQNGSLDPAIFTHEAIDFGIQFEGDFREIFIIE